MHIAFLHTADVHAQTFDTIIQQIAPQAQVTHRVEADLLARAQSQSIAEVRSETSSALAELAHADAVVCTCSTLGPIADEMTEPHVFRIDRPMMQSAVLKGGKVLIAICLESTREPSLALFADCAAENGRAVKPITILCADAWPHFVAGDTEAFSTAIAHDVRQALTENPDARCVILAQASMRAAAHALSDLPIPVLSSPEMAAREAVRIAVERTKL